MSDGTGDAKAFLAFERAGWEDAGAAYADGLAAVTVQAVEPLLDAVRAGTGVRLLDVATGPGLVAGAAARRGAHAIGIDLADAMVAEARQRHPTAEFRQGEAEALAFADAAFDAVVSNFGMPHFSEPDRFLAEASRVLRPGGRLAFTAWLSPSEVPFFGIVRAAVEAHGRTDIALPAGPDMFRFGDPVSSLAAMTAAGFVDATVVEVPLVTRAADPKGVIDFYTGTVRTRALLDGQTGEAAVAIEAAMLEALQPYVTERGVEMPMPALLTSARRP